MYDVHVLNFDGHGGSAIPSELFSMEMFRNSILNYMEENSISAAHFFGYSMGGYVALSLAAEFPERVKSVLTLATKFDWNEITASAEMKKLEPDIISDKVPEFAEILRQRHAPENWKVVVMKTRDFIASLGIKPLQERDFKKIKCKVRIVVGDRDKMVSVIESLKVYSHLSSGSLMVLPETSHPFELVDANKIINELNEFIKVE